MQGGSLERKRERPANENFAKRQEKLRQPQRLNPLQPCYASTTSRLTLRQRPRRDRFTFTNGSATAGPFSSHIRKISLRYAPPSSAPLRALNRSSRSATRRSSA